VPLQAYSDEDVRAHGCFVTPAFHARAERAAAPAQPEEYFFCCTWAFHETTGAALLLFAGQKGVIRILDANAQALCQVRCAAAYARARPNPTRSHAEC